MVDERVSGLDEEGEMSEFVADNGVRVSDEMVSRWAGEAESGLRGCRSTRSGVELGRKWRLNPWNLARSE